MAGEGVMVVHGGRDKFGPLADLHLFRFGAHPAGGHRPLAERATSHLL
jgi:hypothetical protein